MQQYVLVAAIGGQQQAALSLIKTLMEEKSAIKKQNYKLSQMVFAYSAYTQDAVNAIKTLCKKPGYVEPEFVLDPDGFSTPKVLKDKIAELKANPDNIVLFSTDGGRNFEIDEIICQNTDKIDLIVAQGMPSVKLFNPHDGYKLVDELFISKFETALEIIENSTHKKPVIVENKGHTKLDDFIYNCGITFNDDQLEDGALCNVIIDGINCARVWNDGSNRLAILCDIRDFNLEQTREFARQAISKELSILSKIYDKTIYAYCKDNFQKQHVLQESLGKVIPLKTKGYLDRISDQKKRVEKSAEALKEIAFLFKIQNIGWVESKKVEVPNDSLVLAVGSDIAITLKAIDAHILCHGIKNVILLATVSDNRVHDIAISLRKVKNRKGLRAIVFDTDVQGTNIDDLIVGEDPQNIQVNPIPGTKAQGAALTCWCLRHGFKAWSIYNPENCLMCLNKVGERTDNNTVKAFDAVELLSIYYPTSSKTLSKARKDDDEFSKLYLEYLKGCNEAHQKWFYKKDNEFNGIKYTYKEFKREPDPKRPGKYLPAKGVMTLSKDGKTLSYNFDGGDWFEALTAQAFREAQCDNVYDRVRVDWDNNSKEILKHKMSQQELDETFRIDMDVLGSYKGTNFLVSCKAMPQDDEANPHTLEFVAEEARRMASSIARYARPIVCYTLKYKFKGEIYFNENKPDDNGIFVIDWKDLINPQRLLQVLAISTKKPRTQK